MVAAMAGALSSDPARNPSFSNASLVFVHYCDGTSTSSAAVATLRAATCALAICRAIEGQQTPEIALRVHSGEVVGIAGVEGERGAVLGRQRRAAAAHQAAVDDVVVHQERVVQQLDRHRGRWDDDRLCLCLGARRAVLTWGNDPRNPLYRLPPMSRLAYNKVGVATGIQANLPDFPDEQKRLIAATVAGVDRKSVV